MLLAEDDLVLIGCRVEISFNPFCTESTVQSNWLVWQSLVYACWQTARVLLAIRGSVVCPTWVEDEFSGLFTASVHMTPSIKR